MDITYILFDNGIYGLTKGQSSPTTPKGQITGTHPYGNPDTPLNPTLLGLVYGASFVARGYAGEPHNLNKLIYEALTHKGFSLMHVITPCVTFDKVNITYDKMRDKWEPLPEEHKTSDHSNAVKLAADPSYYFGVFYQENRETWKEAVDITTKNL